MTLRFYAELNDYLASAAPIGVVVTVAGGEGVGEVIQDCRVPLDQVDLIVLDGESVDFSHRVAEGDRFGVYPVFESFDVAAVVRVRSRPLRVTRFLVDTGLEPLAERLRRRGFDTTRRRGRSLAGTVEAALAERRVLLARDRELLAFPGVTHGYLVEAGKPDDQLVEVAHRLQLGDIEPSSQVPPS